MREQYNQTIKLFYDELFDFIVFDDDRREALNYNVLMPIKMIKRVEFPTKELRKHIVF